MKLYIYLLNNEMVGFSESNEFTIRNLTPDTTYNNIYAIAIDKNVNLKYSSNKLETTTLSEFVDVGEVIHTERSITTYSWQKLKNIANMIAENPNITSDTAEVIGNINGEDFTIGVGDTTNVVLNNVTYPVRILGFNHDDLKTPVTRNGVTVTKAGISFEFTVGIDWAQISGVSSTVGWESWSVRTTLNNYVNNNKIDIANHIVTVNKKYIVGTTVNTSSGDKLWLLACSEIWNNGYTTGAYGNACASEGEQYKYYKIKNAKYNVGNSGLIKLYNNQTQYAYWLLRSPDAKNSGKWCMLDPNGRMYTYDAGYGSSSKSPAFAI